MRTKVGGPVKIDATVDATSITVAHGEEVFSPVQYHSFRVGGHSITVAPRDGESALDAAKRASVMLAELVDWEFEQTRAAFKDRLNRCK